MVDRTAGRAHPFAQRQTFEFAHASAHMEGANLFDHDGRRLREGGSIVHGSGLLDIL
jgi:hypothetical protein